MKSMASVTTACALALAGLGTARAVSLNPKGTGQVLIYPYYTVNAQLNSLFSLVNGTDRGKAVKVRFREGMNSRVVADLTVYLSPFDVWTAALFGLSEDGPANLLTDDNSCTLPKVKGNVTLPQLGDGRRYQPFSNAAYSGSNNDPGPNDVLRTREGFIEVIEMGEVTNATHATLTAISHEANGLPTNCAQVFDAWNGASANTQTAYWALQDSKIDMAPPAGGLFGSVWMIDVLNGKIMADNATALDAFSASIQNTPPGSALPDLSSANTTPDRADALVFDAQGAPVVASYPIERAIDAVSAVLSADTVLNEFVEVDGGGAESEWILTFPTRNYYVDPAIIGTGAALPPFTDKFTIRGSAADFFAGIFNREGPVEVFVCEPSDPNCCCIGITPPVPPPPPPPNLAWASNVLTFNQFGGAPLPEGAASAIFGSRLIFDIDAAGVGVREGGLKLSLYQSPPPADSDLDLHVSRPDLSGKSVFGLPVVGFWAVSFTNGEALPGVLANYTTATPHRWTSRYDTAPQ